MRSARRPWWVSASSWAFGCIGLFRTIPPSSLQKLIPIIWVCLAIQVGSGILLWLTKPGRYLSDGLFDVKMAFVDHGLLHDDAVPEDDQGGSRWLGFDRHDLEARACSSSA